VVSAWLYKVCQVTKQSSLYPGICTILVFVLIVAGSIKWTLILSLLSYSERSRHLHGYLLHVTKLWVFGRMSFCQSSGALFSWMDVVSPEDNGHCRHRRKRRMPRLKKCQCSYYRPGTMVVVAWIVDALAAYAKHPEKSQAKTRRRGFHMEGECSEQY
jgi:hypothetical protein